MQYYIWYNNHAQISCLVDGYVLFWFGKVEFTINLKVSSQAIFFVLVKQPRKYDYHQSSNIRHALAGNKIVDHSDVVGASPVGAAPTTSSFLT